MRALVLALLVAGCAEDSGSRPPTCENADHAHGCYKISCVDQRPTDTATCTCWYDGADGNPVRETCTIEPPPPCGDLACESIQCGEITPEGDTDPTACVCWVGSDPSQCVGEP